MTPSLNLHAQLPQQRLVNGSRNSVGPMNPLKRQRTPDSLQDVANSTGRNGSDVDKEFSVAEDHKRARLKDLYARSDRIIEQLFTKNSSDFIEHAEDPKPSDSVSANGTQVKAGVKRSAREIDEDYDDEDEDDDDNDQHGNASPLHSKGPPLPKKPRLTSAPDSTEQTTLERKSNPEQEKSSEEVRKKLEEEKKAKEDAAKESFLHSFYTLENDRDAMLEQQKLDELDRQVETEISGGNANSNNANSNGAQQGTLSSANLGASSLTLKHLISKIDEKRDMVRATDFQLRSLMSEVRKNRSKWANEDKVGQEELYEAAEKVLMELKAQTEWAAPFLQRVNKRDAPNYYNIIKHPMDIGTMLRKLKSLQYKSKKEFCDDLELIWSNCFKYNEDPTHFLRKKAEHMRKETARLTPLIPDIVVRDRAEVEAEERRMQHDFDDEESDEEPIITSRGRKAPGKSSKKGLGTTRKAPPATKESTPGPDSKPQPLTASALDPLSHLKNEHLRSDIDTATEGSHHGATTPPPGNLTPLGPNGIPGSAAPGSHADPSELEGPNGLNVGQSDDIDQEDEEYQTWKQVTKKDRARVAAERNRLFKGDRLNPEEPALLRTKGKMQRWMRLQKKLRGERDQVEDMNAAGDKEGGQEEQSATLAEGMEGEEDSTLPDYYDPLSAIPHLNDRLEWKEDDEGHATNHYEECFRLLPEGHFTAPKSKLTAKMDANMRQMQETRKIVSKINVVKQMQVQAQTYQNQFQRYDPEPFLEADVGPVVVSDDGPFMTAPGLYRSALQRSVGKIFYHAGFEEFQPSALDVITDMAASYFHRLTHVLKLYKDCPKIYEEIPETAQDPTAVRAKDLSGPTPQIRKFALRSRFTDEEVILHSLYENGLDLDGLDGYVKEDFDRLGSKLETQHTRTKDYLSELLRPALDPSQVGADGAGAFYEGSEQFVGGDFAEDLGEDYFGFKELGLDEEFGLTYTSVPLHLLQSRVHSRYQPTNASASATSGDIMEQPPPYPPITKENVGKQIGLVQEFFSKRLEEANNDEPLIEDDELPAKQRFPKPRLPPSGKISSPRKRPIREQQQMARKKKRLEIEAEREREREKENNSGAGVSAEVNGIATDKKGNNKHENANVSTDNTTMMNQDTIVTSNKKTSDSIEETTATTSAAEQPSMVSKDQPLVNGDTASYDPEATSNQIASSNLVTSSAEHITLTDETDEQALKDLVADSEDAFIRLDMPEQDEHGNSVDGQKGDPEKPATVTEDQESTSGKEKDEEAKKSSEGGGGGDENEGAGGGDGDDADGQNGILNTDSLPIAAH